MSSYFRNIPDFEYISRYPNAKISEYAKIKNLFKRAKLRDDIFENLSFFEKYKVRGDDRPDNVAFEVYGDSNLDWIVLLSNNILNIQTEWPLSQRAFDRYLFSKYTISTDTETDTYNRIYNGVHHYETVEVKNSQGIVMVPGGVQVDSGYSTTYYDFYLEQIIDTGDISLAITNYQYESDNEDKKRNIYLLKPDYLQVVFNDMDEIMKYKEGSSQYVTETLKKGDNIRLYE